MRSIRSNSLFFRSKSAAFCAALIGFSIPLPASQAATVGTNLIVNGSGQASINVGWSVIQNGGSGWGTDFTGGADGQPGFFTTSYVLDQRSQLIDLQADGYSAVQLDAGPLITASEAVKSNPEFVNPGGPDHFYIKVQLLAADMSVLAEWDVGSATAFANAPDVWTTLSHDFSGYGPGVRYVYFEDGGVDTGFWAGDYGTGFDAASVTVTPVPEPRVAIFAVTAVSGASLLRRRRP